MMCFEDRAFCDKELCKNYRNCKDSLYQAIKRQERIVKDKEEHLPYAVRDMSRVCNKHKPCTL